MSSDCKSWIDHIEHGRPRAPGDGSRSLFDSRNRVLGSICPGHFSCVSEIRGEDALARGPGCDGDTRAQGVSGEAEAGYLGDSHACMGAMERANRTLGEPLRTTKHGTETEVGGIFLHITHRSAGWRDTVVGSTADSMCGQTVGRIAKSCDTAAREI